MKATFLLTLPNGERALCRSRDAYRIREDVQRYGSVLLIRAPGEEVYTYIAWDSAEGKQIRQRNDYVHIT